MPNSVSAKENTKIVSDKNALLVMDKKPLYDYIDFGSRVSTEDSAFKLILNSWYQRKLRNRLIEQTLNYWLTPVYDFAVSYEYIMSNNQTKYHPVIQECANILEALHTIGLALDSFNSPQAQDFTVDRLLRVDPDVESAMDLLAESVLIEDSHFNVAFVLNKSKTEELRLELLKPLCDTFNTTAKEINTTIMNFNSIFAGDKHKPNLFLYTVDAFKDIIRDFLPNNDNANNTTTGGRL